MIDVRSLLNRLGSVPPFVLGLIYTACFLLIRGVEALVTGTIAGSMFVTVLSLIVFSLLFVTIAWFREDDWLSAGALLTLIVYAGVAIQALLVVAFRGGIGPATLSGAVTIAGAILSAIILAPIAGGFIALARKLTRESLRTVR